MAEFGRNSDLYRDGRSTGSGQRAQGQGTVDVLLLIQNPYLSRGYCMYRLVWRLELTRHQECGARD